MDNDIVEEEERVHNQFFFLLLTPSTFLFSIDLLVRVETYRKGTKRRTRNHVTVSLEHYPPAIEDAIFEKLL